MRFVLHVSDLHMGGPPADFPPRLAAMDKYIGGFLHEVRNLISDGHLCGVVFGGDYVNRGWFASCGEAVALMRQITTGLKVPEKAVAMCVGNHDLDLNAQDDTFKKKNGNVNIARKAMYEHFKNDLWEPMIGSVHDWAPVCGFTLKEGITVVGIDTCQCITRNSRDTPSLPCKATEQFKAIIQGLPDNKGSSVLLAMHHPPIPVASTFSVASGCSRFIWEWAGFRDTLGTEVRGVLYGNQHEPLTREDVNQFNKMLYVGCRTFWKLGVANLGASLVGLDDRGNIARIIDIAYVTDQNENPWLSGHWTNHNIFKKHGQAQKPAIFSDTQPVSHIPGIAAKKQPKVSPYEVCDSDLARTIESWVNEEKLLIKGRFAVHADKLSVTWIDVERLLTDPEKVTEMAVKSAYWLRKRPDLSKTILVGADTNGAILATRIAGMVGTLCTYIISTRRAPFHAPYEIRFNIPARASTVIIVTDVVSTGSTLNDIASEVRTKCKGRQISLEVLCMFLSPRLTHIGRNLPTTCLCDRFTMDVMDVVERNAATDLLPLDLDLRQQE